MCGNHLNTQVNLNTHIFFLMLNLKVEYSYTRLSVGRRGCTCMALVALGQSQHLDRLNTDTESCFAN